MSLLSRVVTGKIEQPHLVMLNGTDGIGKSSWAASAPKPIFIGPEAGSNQLDVARFPAPKDWGEVLAAIGELTTEAHDFKTLVVDSIDWLEPILFESICRDAGVINIEKVDGGFGKGYVEAVRRWKEFTSLLSNLRAKRGMNIILIGHVEVTKHSDPTLQADYDRYTLKLNKKAAALLREFVDCVLFAKFETFTKKDGQKHRAIGDGARVMYTEWRPAFDAKNRFNLPFQLPLSWDQYDLMVRGSTGGKALEDLKSELAELLPQVRDDELRKKVIEAIEKAGDDVTKLLAIKNRVQVRLGAQS
jgi:hypothetical protein